MNEYQEIKKYLDHPVFQTPVAYGDGSETGTVAEVLRATTAWRSDQRFLAELEPLGLSVVDCERYLAAQDIVEGKNTDKEAAQRIQKKVQRHLRRLRRAEDPDATPGAPEPSASPPPEELSAEDAEEDAEDPDEVEDDTQDPDDIVEAVPGTEGSQGALSPASTSIALVRPPEGSQDALSAFQAAFTSVEGHDVDPELVDETLIGRWVDESKGAGLGIVVRAHMIGRALAAQKERRSGEFGKWVEEALPFSPRTARNYMQLYRHFKDAQENGNALPVELLNGSLRQALRALKDAKSPSGDNAADKDGRKGKDPVTLAEVAENILRLFTRKIGKLPEEERRDAAAVVGVSLLEHAGVLVRRQLVPYRNGTGKWHPEGLAAEHLRRIAVDRGKARVRMLKTAGEVGEG